MKLATEILKRYNDDQFEAVRIIISKLESIEPEKIEPVNEIPRSLDVACVLEYLLHCVEISLDSHKQIGSELDELNNAIDKL